MFPMKNSFMIAKIPFPSLCSYTVLLQKGQADLMAEFYRKQMRKPVQKIKGRILKHFICGNYLFPEQPE